MSINGVSHNEAELIEAMLEPFVKAVSEYMPEATGREAIDRAAYLFEVMARMCREATPAVEVLS